MSLAQYGPIETHSAFAEPKDYAAHLMEQAKSSFTLGMKALAKPRREAMFAVYAFCRMVDDIADEPGSLDEKLALLQAWREEIDRLYENNPKSLIGRSLLEPVARFHLPKEEFLSLIEGMETDVNGPVIRPALKDLLIYTRQVAGTVGMLSIRIFGVNDTPDRDPFALALADALQLTNILRDIDEDAKEGRLYLPDELLNKHGVTDREPEAVAKHPYLQAVRRDLGKIARARFTKARRTLQKLDRRKARPALMMMGVYEGYLDLMERHDFATDPKLYKMGKFVKLARGLRYAFAFPERPLTDDHQTLSLLEANRLKG